VTRQRRPPGARLLALYPGEWRRRYEPEVAWILERAPLTMRSSLDLIRGAIDAHLHPDAPSPLPVLAAVVAAGLLTAHAIVLAVQPVAPDWPGYLDDGLPLVGLAVAALLPALVGLWLKLGDHDGVVGRVGIVLGLAGHAAWLVAIVAAGLRIEYGPLTAVASTVAMTGMACLGVALVGAGRAFHGVVLAIAALAGVAPPGVGWPLFAATWTTLGLKLLLEFERPSRRGGPRRA